MCEEKQETVSHFLTCPHWNSNSENEIITKRITKLNIHPIVCTWVKQYVNKYNLNENSIKTSSYPILLIETVQINRLISTFEQTLKQIGPHDFIFGFIPKSSLFKPLNQKQSYNREDTTVKLITICHDIILTKWKIRNDTCHQNKLETNQIIERNKLLRYILQPPPVISWDIHLFKVYQPHQVESLDITLVYNLLSEI